jgi:hypothetical protein
MIVAWTGHRPELFLHPNDAQARLTTESLRLQREGADRFLVGGQRGVDTWAADAAIAQAIPFVVVLPLTLDEFTRDWTSPERVHLEQTLARANELRIAGGYSERNRQLATSADLVVAVWTRTRGGGTAQTIDFARTAGTPIRELVLEAAPNAGSAQGRGI